jgi:signal transduction histidine kinase
VADALVNFDSALPGTPIDTGSLDEIGRLEQDFDAMAKRIQAEENNNLALSQHLTQKTAQQQDLLRRLITAQEEERKRLARELHDELGQSLSGLAIHAEVVSKVIASNPSQAQEELSLIRKQIGRTTDQMYELIMALRPSILDDLGLVAALQAHAERVLNGTKFSLDAEELTTRLPAAIETSLYRIFQEALNNVVRHSSATQVWVRLARRDGEFFGEIKDNGRGFKLEETHWKPGNPHGLGLLGMQERLAECGGRFEINTQPGAGTRLCIYIPLEEACDE